MSLDEFMEYIKTQIVTDYIVRLKYKYNHETDYTITNEIFVCEIGEDGVNYLWLNDWYEGQQDIKVLGCIPVESVTMPNFKGGYHRG